MCSKIWDKKANFDKVSSLVQRDIKKGVDIIVLPEVWTVGWAPKHFRESAEEVKNSETIKLLSNIAKDYNTWVVGGSFISKSDEHYYNTCPLLNRKGELVALYSKNHLFSYYGSDEGTFVEVGKSPVMVDIEGVKTGLTICYDIRFPEIYRAYRKAGADLFINCAAWGLKKPIGLGLRRRHPRPADRDGLGRQGYRSGSPAEQAVREEPNAGQACAFARSW